MVSKILALLLLFSPFALGTQVKIGIQRAPLFAQPNRLSRPLRFLYYGDFAQVLQRRNNWYYVAVKNTRGWIHGSSFSKPQKTLDRIGQGRTVPNFSYKDELVTGGKGYEVQKKVKKIKKEKNRLKKKAYPYKKR